MEVQLLITRQEAADLLNISLSHFQRHVQTRLPCVRSGQLRLYRHSDLERWIDDQLRPDPSTPSSGCTGFTEAHERFVADCRSGAALNKQGRAYKAKAITNLDSSLRRVPDAIRRKPLGAVRRGELQEAVDGFGREGLSASRIASIVNAVRSLYRWAIDRERASEDPASLVRLPVVALRERDRIATPGEFALLLSCLDSPDALPWALAGYGTARLQEVQLLAWTEVDLGDEVMLLAAEETARKSDAARRVIPLVGPLCRRLDAEWMRQGRPSTGRVCPPRARSRSGLLSLNQLSKRVKRIWEGSGLRPIGLQDSRHTAATWLDHSGVPPKVCSVLMGHRATQRDLYPGAAPITLRRYTHVLPGEIRRAGDKLDAFLAEREAEEEDDVLIALRD